MNQETQVEVQEDTFTNSKMVVDHFRIMNEQRDKFDQIEAKLSLLISDLTVAKKLSTIVRKIYAQSYTTYRDQEKQEVDPSIAFYNGILNDILAKTNEVCKIQGSENTKELNKLIVQIYRARKKLNKDCRSVPYSLLTPGTIFKATIDHRKDGQVTHEVDYIAVNGVDSYIVYTKTPNPSPVMSDSFPFEAFNISYIDEVVSHKPGVLKWDDKRSDANYFKDAFFKNIPGKGKRNYKVADLSYLVAFTIYNDDLLKDRAEEIDRGALAFYIKQYFKIEEDEYIRWTEGFKVNKKKFRRLIHQNVNRFKVPLKVAIIAQEEYNNQSYQDGYDD